MLALSGQLGFFALWGALRNLLMWPWAAGAGKQQ